MERTLKARDENKNQLKIRFSELEGDLLYKTMQIEAMSHQVECTKERTMNLAAENESIRVMKCEIIALRVIHCLVKLSDKATKLIVKTMEAKYVFIGLYIESMFTA